MKHLLYFSFIAVVASACNTTAADKKPVSDSTHIYPTVSYLHIKLDSAGQLPSNPYILEFENGNKKIMFCGVNHLTDDADTANPMFAKIEEKFFAFKPTAVINEGGDISGKTYASKQEALLKDGEIGLTKILCDSLKIQPTDGDPAAAFEFNELLKRYTKGEFLAYIVTERLMWGLKGQRISDSAAIEQRYNTFVQNYIMKKGGVALTQAEQSFEFYTSNYQQLLQRPFAIATLEPTNPFKPVEKFQEIGRVSKEIRDQFLLRTIDTLLHTNDRVFIVFGGWHLLTCKPGLEEIIKRSHNNNR